MLARFGKKVLHLKLLEKECKHTWKRLVNFIKKTSLTIQAPFRSWCYDYYHSFDTFRDEYKHKFDKKPFIEATPQFFW